MRTVAVAFVLSMLCAALLTPLVRKLAHRYGALDQAHSARKIHGRPVPRLGGIAIVIAFFAPLVGLLVFESDVGALFLAEKKLVLGIFIGGVLIAGLGIYDDLRGTGAGKKFTVQFAVAGLMYGLGFRVTEIAHPFGESIHLGWVSLPFTLFWIVGIINAMNLVDGLDGLAGGVALVAVSTILVVSVHNVQPLMILFCAALAGSIVGFLFYNFNPASIFMGDTGSMFLGFVLATSSIQTGQKSSTAIAVFIPAIILAFPILDTLLAMGRRALHGRPMFHADKEHIHHRLLGLGFSHKQTVWVLYSICVFLGGVALAILYTQNQALTLALLAGLAAVVLYGLRRLGYLRFEARRYLSDVRRRNRILNASLNPVTERLRGASSEDEMWSALRELATIVQAVGVRMQLPAIRQNTTFRVLFSDGFAEPSPPASSPEPYCARFRLPNVTPEEGMIELAWRDGRASLDRDLEIAIERFCSQAAVTHERLRGRRNMPPRPEGARGVMPT